MHQSAISENSISEKYIVASVVMTVWRLSICAATLSLVLWISQVQQVSSWQAIVPATALLTALFAIVTSIRWHHGSSIPVRTVIGTSTLSALWALAIAVGL